jgi:beta-lactamase class A
MMDLMHQDELDWWLDAGLPEDVDAANKAGWLYEVYDDVGIVKAGNRHYVVAIMSKYGQSLDGGESLIKDLSKAVWDSQSSGGS